MLDHLPAAIWLPAALCRWKSYKRGLRLPSMHFTNKALRLLIVFLTGFFSGTFPFFGVSHAASHFRISVETQSVAIEARETPLIELLKALSRQTDIVLVTSDSLEEPISVSIHAKDLNESIERLLQKHNYAVLFSQSPDGSFAISEIRVIGSKSPVSYLPHASPEGLDDHMQHYSKTWYVKEFRNTDKLSRQITATPAKSRSHKEDPPDLEEGIEVRHVAENSVFNQIGIREGDLIRNVNGVPVKTTEEFLNALQAASEQPPMVRIERLDAGNEIDPIYIELH
jgi:hypothetical protein